MVRMVSCFVMLVLTLVSLKLGASEIYLGVLSFALFGMWGCRMFTLTAVEKHGKRKVMIFWMTISVLFIIPLLLLPFLVNCWSSSACLALILIAAFLRVGTYSLGNAGWFPILHDIVPQPITGRYFANMRTLWQIAGLITGLLITWLLWDNSDWWRFEIVFLVGLMAFVCRVATLVPMVENPTISAKPKISIPERFHEVICHKQLRRLVFYIIAYLIAATIAEPFKIKFLKDHGYGDGFILLTSIAMISVGAIVSLRFWGRFADRFGNSPIFAISHLMMPVVAILWLFVDNNRPILVLCLFFVWGVFDSGNRIGQTRYVLHSVAADKQNQINIINIASGLSMGIAPLLGGVFLRLTGQFGIKLGSMSFNNYHFLFIISAALFVLLHLLHREIEPKKNAAVIPPDLPGQCQ